MSAAKGIAAGLGIGLLFATASPASAATCEVNPQGVSFGSYDSLGLLPLDGNGNIHVSCSLPTSFTVSLGSGAGTIADRQMTGGSGHLSYNLYKGPARIIVWGDGPSSVSALGSNVDLSVYGRIPARQNVPAGAYIDSITVTVTY